MNKDPGIAKNLTRSAGYALRFGRHGIAAWHEVVARAEPSAGHTDVPFSCR
jgi:hypothetical protein